MCGYKQTYSGQPASVALRLMAVFVPLYTYVWLVVDPLLIHHFQCQIFQAEVGFFGEFLSRPAGLIGYVSALLGQLYFWPWAGAMVITATILAACLAGGAFLSAVTPRSAWWVSLLAAAPLVSLHTSYDYPLHVSLAAAVALASSAGFVRLPLHRSWVRVAVFLLLSVAVYYVAGAAMLLFALLCGLYELLVARRWIVGSVGTAVSAGVPYAAARCVLLLDVGGAYSQPLSFGYEIGVPVASIGLYAIFPIATIALAFREPIVLLARAGWRRICPRRGGQGARDGNCRTSSAGPSSPQTRGSAAASRRRGRLGWALGTLALPALCGASAWASLDAGKRSVLRIDYLARQEDWQALLREVRRLPLKHVDPDVVCNTDRALFHTGRLPHDMFAYPHHSGMPGLTLFLGTGYIPENGRICMKTSDLLFELGHINEAEHMAYEALEFIGNRPHLLKRLFMVYVLKGQPVAARTYLAALEKSPLHAKEARRYRRLLRQDPRLATLKEIAVIRPLMPTTDSRPWSTTEQLLLHLLHQNPRNRMAFEYLMAHYLLHGRPDKVAWNIGHLRHFGETEIPRHYEEAIALYGYLLRARKQVRPIPLHGLRLRPGAQRRLEEFLELKIRLAIDRKRAEEALENVYADSYYFYYFFGMTKGRKGWRDATN